jgi:hypothetical protein
MEIESAPNPERRALFPGAFLAQVGLGRLIAHGLGEKDCGRPLSAFLAKHHHPSNIKAGFF